MHNILQMGLIYFMYVCWEKNEMVWRDRSCNQLSLLVQIHILSWMRMKSSRILLDQQVIWLPVSNQPDFLFKNLLPLPQLDIPDSLKNWTLFRRCVGRHDRRLCQTENVWSGEQSVSSHCCISGPLWPLPRMTHPVKDEQAVRSFNSAHSNPYPTCSQVITQRCHRTVRSLHNYTKRRSSSAI